MSETYRHCYGKPRISTIPGHGFAGIVEDPGAGCCGCSRGYDVYALSLFCREDSAAEFIAIRAADLAPKPHSLNFEHVALALRAADLYLR